MPTIVIADELPLVIDHDTLLPMSVNPGSVINEHSGVGLGVEVAVAVDVGVDVAVGVLVGVGVSVAGTPRSRVK